METCDLAAAASIALSIICASSPSQGATATSYPTKPVRMEGVGPALIDTVAGRVQVMIAE